MIHADFIRSLVTRRPFEPFTLHLSGGVVYKVRHPETVAVGKQRLVVVDSETDQMAVCSLLHLTSIQTAQSMQ
jgi:hypothetical protein